MPSSGRRRSRRKPAPFRTERSGGRIDGRGRDGELARQAGVEGLRRDFDLGRGLEVGADLPGGLRLRGAAGGGIGRAFPSRTSLRRATRAGVLMLAQGAAAAVRPGEGLRREKAEGEPSHDRLHAAHAHGESSRCTGLPRLVRENSSQRLEPPFVPQAVEDEKPPRLAGDGETALRSPPQRVSGSSRGGRGRAAHDSRSPLNPPGPGGPAV